MARFSVGRVLKFGIAILTAYFFGNWITGDILHLQGLTKMVIDVGVMGGIGYYLWEKVLRPM